MSRLPAAADSCPTDGRLRQLVAAGGASLPFGPGRTAVEDAWTATDRRVGIAVAWTLSAVSLVYVLVMMYGFVVGGIQAPLVDPVFAVMELLILVSTPLIVVLFGEVHRYVAPDRRVFSLAAFALTVVAAVVTMGVHFVPLTVGRQVQPSNLPGFDRLLSFAWPSVPYALDILAWDYCFGLAVMLAAPVFGGGRSERAIRTGLIVAGVLCLVGLLGAVTANVQIRNIGIAGYGVIFPVVTMVMARVFGDDRVASVTRIDRTGTRVRAGAPPAADRAR